MIYSIAHALVEGTDFAPARPRQRWGRWAGPARKPLRLTLNGRSMTFRSVDDFAFAVQSRTSVPSDRAHGMFERTAADLRAESQRIRAVEKNLVDVLEDTLLDGGPCGPALRRLGLHVFSGDHGWRELVAALIDLDDRFDGYKRVALIKYMQYLGARQQVLKVAFAAATDRSEDVSEIDAAPGETLVFDAGTLPLSAVPDDLLRLPPGRSVRLYALPGHPIAVRLAKHPFTLVNEDGWCLREPRGVGYRLGDGACTIGRGRDNRLRLGPEYGYVSRRHLVAEPIDDHVIALTDRSSHGTYVPPKHTEDLLG